MGNSQTPFLFCLSSTMETRNDRALRVTVEEANALLDALDSLSEPLTSWDDHDSLRSRICDLVIWMESD